ncbi:hypothetical protein BDQ17DRAFT_1329738 [Cyathus striatus]|nr:hypothetical protein BDQ17DRAFT_1329738 [Cyathus striatus]
MSSHVGFAMAGMSIAEVIFTMRVWAVWGKNRWSTFFLPIFFITCWFPVYALVGTTVHATKLHGFKQKGRNYLLLIFIHFILGKSTHQSYIADYFDVVIFTGRVIRANLACRNTTTVANTIPRVVYAYRVTLEYYVEVQTQMFSKRFDLLAINSSGNGDARTGLMNPTKFVATPNSIVTSDTALKHQQNVTVTNTDCIHQAIFPRISQPNSVTISSSSPHVLILTIRIWAVWGKSGMAIKTAKSRILSREGA